jgi:hypothetical protein
MVKLIAREKVDMTDVDVVVGWMMEAATSWWWSVGDREGERKLTWHGR